jgi:voltage-gated potassium channel
MSRGEKLKGIEEFPRRIKVFFFVIIFILFIGTFGFKIMTGVIFKDALLRTLETLAFIFGENSSISVRLFEVFLALVGVFLIWWVLWSTADMLLEGNLGKYLKTKFYNIKLIKLKSHSIIVGGGRVGEEISRVMALKKRNFLIIESDAKIVDSLKKKKYIVIEGDALKEEILKKAGIEKASKIILTLPKTESNILITLTAKEINPKIEIHSRCENSSLVSKLKRAGAKVVTVPEIVAADKIASDLGI